MPPITLKRVDLPAPFRPKRAMLLSDGNAIFKSLNI